MSDKDTFTALLRSAGLDFGPAPHPELWPAGHEVIEVANCGGVGGYGGFTSSWHFTAEGKLIGVGHWE